MRIVSSPAWITAALAAVIFFTLSCSSDDNSGPPAPTSPAWGTAGAFDALSSSVGDFAAVMDGGGNVTAIWEQNDGSALSLHASRYDATGGSWSAPVPLESENGGGAFSVQAAVNASGVVLAVWVQSTGSQLNVDYSRYVPGTGWSTASSIATNTNSTGRPSVAIDANGDGFALWTTGLATTPDVFASRFTGSTGTWAVPVTIDSENLGTLEPLAGGIGFIGNGDAVATWQQFDGSWQNVWANTWSATGGTWGTAQILESQPVGASRPQVSVGGDDSVMAVWSQGAVYASRYTGSWTSETELRTDTSVGGDMAAVAATSLGDAMAVWRQSNGTTIDIKTRLYTQGSGTWGTVTAVDSDDTVSMTEPSIAVDNSGNFIVAWRENATPGNVWVATYDASGSAWGSPVNLDTIDGAALTPLVLADSTGRLTVIWRQEGASANVYDLWAVRFQ